MEAALDRALFTRVVKCLGVHVMKQDVASLRKRLGRANLLTIPNIRGIISDATNADRKIILLNPETRESDVSNVLANFPDTRIEEHQVVVDYQHWSADEVLRALLPGNVEVPSGFETVGHLAHLNLRPEHQPYKHRIGQVLLEKSNSNLRTIINKTGVIESKFRTFPMELLAGEEDYMVEAKCNGYRFRFDYSAVYWNSKLSEEHERLTRDYFARKTGDIVVDAFCGVGPFAVRAAAHDCPVLANDLNPESVKSLVENAKLNKLALVDFRAQSALESVVCKPGTIAAYNMDARDFLRQVFAKLEPMPGQQQQRVHVVMNLPAIAIEFLDAMLGAIPNNFPFSAMPLVHCYCFAQNEDEAERQRDVISRAEHVLQCAIPMEDVKVRTVRDVAPKKYMMCISFTLPKQAGVRQGAGEEEMQKRVKTG